MAIEVEVPWPLRGEWLRDYNRIPWVSHETAEFEAWASSNRAAGRPVRFHEIPHRPTAMDKITVECEDEHDAIMFKLSCLS